MKLIAMRVVSFWLGLAAIAAPAASPAKAADGVPDGPTRLLRFADVSKDKVVFVNAFDRSRPRR